VSSAPRGCTQGRHRAFDLEDLDVLRRNKSDGAATCRSAGGETLDSLADLLGWDAQAGRAAFQRSRAQHAPLFPTAARSTKTSCRRCERAERERAARPLSARFLSEETRCSRDTENDPVARGHGVFFGCCFAALLSPPRALAGD
jgi:hypothetical protein